MNVSWNAVPTEEPSIIFPVGAVIEDEKGRYKILSFEKQKNFIHKYQVEVLEQKIPIPDHAKPFIDEKIQWMIVFPQNLANIQRIS